MQTCIEKINISAIATSIPKNLINLSSWGDQFRYKEVKRIIQGTGIQSVRMAPNDLRASDLCFSAATHLIAQLNLNLYEIDAILFVSQTPDAIMPATSVLLQDRLKLAKHVVAFDINYGCSGYIYGLYQAALLIAAGGCKKVLVCAGDVITPLLAKEEGHVRMLFGDAGSATLVEAGTNLCRFIIKTDGSGAPFLQIKKDFLSMNGAEVMEFVLREVPPCVDELLRLCGWQRDEVGAYLFHQANVFIVDYLRKKLTLSKASVPIAVEHTGNTGPASIPLLLSLVSSQLAALGKLNKVVMSGFGAGFSWGSMSANMSETRIFAPIEV